jgi:valyl-tRNA synthetase
MSQIELPKSYEAKEYEDLLYKKWVESGLFNPDICVEKGYTEPNAAGYSIVLPPPNVTGTLHMGHAAMLAIQDVMIRYHRMKGKKTLWIPGTDHAAVATESKVEGKLIKEEGFTRPKEELGREAFLERVRAFAQDSHDTIVNQAKKMGASLDWSREAYTLDDARNLAVRTMFAQMHTDGLIYRGYRVVNWSVKGQSTCSDDELVMIERPAKLYTFTYGPECPIAIATTRPETKLGDTAIAVHPEGRWKQYIGQTFTIADFGQTGHTLTLKVIGDEGVEDDFGTGALGVTPAHSAVDFEMYSKQKAVGNDIGLIAVIGEDGNMTNHAGSEYSGLSVMDAKEKIVAWLRESGRLQKEEDITQNVGTSDRFSDVVEPLPKTQWFIDVNKKIAGKGIFAGRQVSLKEMMQEAVRGGHTRIVPDRFEKTYFHWIDNLRDWCISRQIWFGHQIPVWYKNEEMYCGVTAPDGDGWTQDPDTLDTWFSSGLWTFSTLGWPNETNDLKTYHPTAVLETGYDILFFWVARMILMTTYAIGDVPFKDVYLHGLVRDEQGRKMSKTIGNIIDPLEMIEKFGTDATRLSLLIGGSAGNDVKLSEEKIAGFRNFTNKLWNISRFMLLNIESPSTEIIRPAGATLADKWILSQLDEVVRQATDGLESYQFSPVGEMLRDFTWNDLADWYLEIAKVEGNKSDILNYIFNTMLKLWHPYMPFVTEQIWQEVYGQESVLMVQKWPVASASSQQDNSQFVIVQNVITAIRSIRAQQQIEPAKKVNVTMSAGEHAQLLQENVSVIIALARLENCQIETNVTKPDGAVAVVESGVEIFVDVSGAIDVEKEKNRIAKELAEVEPYITQLEAKLAGDFAKNAPPAIVEKERQKLADAKEKYEKLISQRSSLV